MSKAVELAIEDLLNPVGPRFNVGLYALEQEYRAMDGISQSELKRVVQQKTATDKESSAMRIGSYVDSMLFRGQEETDKLFYVDTVDPPSDSILAVLEYLSDKWPNMDIVPVRDNALILDACNQTEYATKWKDQTRVDKIVPHLDYLKTLEKKKTHTVLSPEEYFTANSVIQSLQQHERTAEYFNFDEDRESLDGIRVFMQWPVEAVIVDHKKDMPFNCKGLLDIIVVDYKNEEIAIIDLKTMSGRVIDFQYQSKKYRYDIQAAMYMSIVGAIFKEVYGDKWDMEYQFIVESTTSPGFPALFKTTEKYIMQGIEGAMPVISPETGRMLAPAVAGLNEYLWIYESYMNSEDHPMHRQWEDGSLLLCANNLTYY